ncbi:MAG: DUF5118 domain-containing protein, partial [Sediminibacterium sp.]
MRKQLLAVALLVSTIAMGQTDSSRTSGPPRGAGNAPGAVRTGPRPYKEVITDKAVTTKGMFTVHRIDDKYYFEIPNAMLEREILSVTRYVKVPTVSGGRGVYGGEIANQQTLAFEKGPSNNVFLRVITLINTADQKDDIYKAISTSNLNAITAAFPIAAWSPDNAGVVIDVTDFFSYFQAVITACPILAQ